MRKIYVQIVCAQIDYRFFFSILNFCEFIDLYKTQLCRDLFRRSSIFHFGSKMLRNTRRKCSWSNSTFKGLLTSTDFSRSYNSRTLASQKSLSNFLLLLFKKTTSKLMKKSPSEPVPFFFYCNLSLGVDECRSHG